MPRSPQPRGREAPQPSGLADGRTVTHQLGGEGERHGDRHAGLVEDGRQAAQQPVGAGQRVGGAEAEQDHGELKPGDERPDDGRPAVTGPPMLTPAAQAGSGTRGMVNRTWPGTPRSPKTISMTTRMTMTTRPMRRKKANERDQGALPRQRHDEAGDGGDQRRGTGWSSSGWRPRPGRRPSPTRPAGAPGGAADRRSFLSRPAAPAEPGGAAEQCDEKGHDDDWQRRVAPSGPARRHQRPPVRPSPTLP